MSKIISLIGNELDSSTRLVEFSQLKNSYISSDFDPQLYESNNILPSFVYGNLVDTETIYKNLNINNKNILLSRESLLIGHFLSVGDTVKLRTFLKDAYEQQATSNPIGFIILETIASIKQEIAFYAERVLAIRGGFNRGRA
ncbi:MAG: hypothetical protein KC505_11335 [Myxococcales bacterium]|nr:hypothetical protein [Myxococcales bacterium]USN51487.1 MAG: hypothetical protein H6731_03520 [Myxococcales bacterium]